MTPSPPTSPRTAFTPFLSAAFALIFLTACARTSPSYIAVTLGHAPIRLLVASTPAERRQGYFSRPEPRDGEGIIFVYDEDVTHGFIMSRDGNAVPFDLGIAFLSPEGVVIEVHRLKARNTDTLHPSQPFRYAIEGAWTFFQKAPVQPGMKLAPLSVLHSLKEPLENVDTP